MSTRGKRLDSIEEQRDRAFDSKMKGMSQEELEWTPILRQPVHR